jgi:hypothetical protein
MTSQSSAPVEEGERDVVVSKCCSRRAKEDGVSGGEEYLFAGVVAEETVPNSIYSGIGIIDRCFDIFS